MLPRVLADSPIGIFDSGVGGLTVMAEVVRRLPHENVVYVADVARMPYGPRPGAEVRGFVEQIVGFLVDMGAKLIVVACNTATAAGLDEVRAVTGIAILGVIGPGARAAVRTTRARKVAVIGTEGTVRSGAYVREINALDPSIEVVCRACPKLAPLIEQGVLEGDPAVKALAEEYLRPLCDSGIDTLVLGCTHYPLLASSIMEVLGPGVQIVDPAVDTAAEVLFMLEELGLLREEAEPVHRFYTSGPVAALQHAVARVLGREFISPPHSFGQVSF